MPDLQGRPDFQWIDDDAGIAIVAAAMAAASWIALDSESNSMFVYQERVCLVQLNVDGKLYVIDPLVSDDPKAFLAPLKVVLEDADKPCFLHGGEYDVACFKREFDISLRGVFDSQQAASFLGWERSGYGSVVEVVCGVRLAKAHSQYNWATRPLAQDALGYALDDVVYLPRVAEQLEAEIATADLEDELAEANRAVMDAPIHVGGFTAEKIYRVKGMRTLASDGQRRLFAVYKWRDECARELDFPPGRLFNDRAMVKLIQVDPKNSNELRRLGVNGRLSRFADSLLATLRQARQNPPAMPSVPQNPPPSPAEKACGERLKKWRRKEAERRDVPLQVVLPARALVTLQSEGAGELEKIPQLGKKRITLYGDELRRLCG